MHGLRSSQGLWTRNWGSNNIKPPPLHQDKGKELVSKLSEDPAYKSCKALVSASYSSRALLYKGGVGGFGSHNF